MIYISVDRGIIDGVHETGTYALHDNVAEEIIELLDLNSVWYSDEPQVVKSEEW